MDPPVRCLNRLRPAPGLGRLPQEVQLLPAQAGGRVHGLPGSQGIAASLVHLAGQQGHLAISRQGQVTVSSAFSSRHRFQRTPS